MNHSRWSPKGNRQMRRILNQATNAAVKLNGSIFQILYGRYLPRLGHNQTIGIIAHKLCRLIWKILHWESATKNEAQRSGKRPSKSAPEKCSENSGGLVTESNRTLLNQPSQHDCHLRLARFSTLRRKGQSQLSFLLFLCADLRFGEDEKTVPAICPCRGPFVIR